MNSFFKEGMRVGNIPAGQGGFISTVAMPLDRVWE
jgi:hypothetical protein